MSLNNPTIWSAILLICLLALLLEGAGIFRLFFVSRQTPRHYLLLLLPISVGIWSFAVLWHALNVTEFSPYINIHIGPALYHMLRMRFDQTIIACQVQSAITFAVFITLLFIERHTLPRIEREPAWLLARERMIHR